VAALVAQAHHRGIKVHLETNGTLPPPRPVVPPGRVAPFGLDTPPGSGLSQEPGVEPIFDWAVISPKPPDYFIAPEWEGLVDELKLVVDEQLSTAAAEELAACHPGAIVAIQPLWEVLAPAGPAGEQRGNRTTDPYCHRTPAEERALRLVMEHPDWRLSLQTHKYLGFR
jgi:organic radical activating enzyme